MKFETCDLQSPLTAYIESIFHFQDFVPSHSVERVVPTGHVYIIFELDGIPRNTFNNETLEPKATYTKVWISGVHRNYISISAHEDSEMFVIQFKPFGAYPFFHFPIETINEQVLASEVLFDGELLNLRQQLLLKLTSREKFQLATKWLNNRFENEKSPPIEFINVLKSLENKAAIDCDQILSNYPNTRKHLINQFKKYTGLTPKYYLRILRFNEILQQIKHRQKITWTQIAYQSGFSDQAHFIKEFKHFSGFNPTEFIAQEYHKEEPNFFPLARRG